MKKKIKKNRVIIHNLPKSKQYLPGINKRDTPIIGVLKVIEQGKI